MQVTVRVLPRGRVTTRVRVSSIGPSARRACVALRVTRADLVSLPVAVRETVPYLGTFLACTHESARRKNPLFAHPPPPPPPPPEIPTTIVLLCELCAVDFEGVTAKAAAPPSPSKAAPPKGAPSKAAKPAKKAKVDEPAAKVKVAKKKEEEKKERVRQVVVSWGCGVGWDWVCVAHGAHASLAGEHTCCTFAGG